MVGVKKGVYKVLAVLNIFSGRQLACFSLLTQCARFECARTGSGLLFVLMTISLAFLVLRRFTPDAMETRFVVLLAHQLIEFALSER